MGGLQWRQGQGEGFAPVRARLLPGLVCFSSLSWVSVYFLPESQKSDLRQCLTVDFGGTTISGPDYLGLYLLQEGTCLACGGWSPALPRIRIRCGSGQVTEFSEPYLHP